jgi:hypothetical protein
MYQGGPVSRLVAFLIDCFVCFAVAFVGLFIIASTETVSAVTFYAGGWIASLLYKAIAETRREIARSKNEQN